jgi:hypothetical protein
VINEKGFVCASGPPWSKGIRGEVCAQGLVPSSVLRQLHPGAVFEELRSERGKRETHQVKSTTQHLRSSIAIRAADAGGLRPRRSEYDRAAVSKGIRGEKEVASLSFPESSFRKIVSEGGCVARAWRRAWPTSNLPVSFSLASDRH